MIKFLSVLLKNLKDWHPKDSGINHHESSRAIMYDSLYKDSRSIITNEKNIHKLFTKYGDIGSLALFIDISDKVKNLIKIYDQPVGEDYSSIRNNLPNSISNAD